MEVQTTFVSFITFLRFYAYNLHEILTLGNTCTASKGKRYRSFSHIYIVKVYSGHPVSSGQKTSQNTAIFTVRFTSYSGTSPHNGTPSPIRLPAFTILLFFFFAPKQRSPNYMTIRPLTNHDIQLLLYTKL